MSRCFTGRTIRHVTVAMLALQAAPGSAQPADVFAGIDRTMEAFRAESHIPGMVWGIVQDGRLVHVQAAGIQDVESKRPVTPETLFRIASMTKAFTALSILRLRDEGALALDAPAETYVPELRGWTSPTGDSPKIRVRDLLTHTGGFVTDDPWGDRQTPMPEDEFTRLLADGVPFTRPPQTAMEYSNFGYALLGRIVGNVAKQPYKDVVQRTLFAPLGMTSTGFDVAASPQERRALGYRWEDDAWKIEPTMAHGAFGAMGGVQTSATDYAKWVAFLLSAWPPRDGADAGPVRRATVRELAQGANYPAARNRPPIADASPCRMPTTYGMGFGVAIDCDLGPTLSHGGGYPGYGSFVLLLPEYGTGIFAFANRTYAGPSQPVWAAALALQKAGKLTPRTLAPSSALTAAYAAAGRIYASGSITGGGDVLAMNVLMDRDVEHWARQLDALKQAVGTCDTSAPIVATGGLAGTFAWKCERGQVNGRLLLAPTKDPRIQTLALWRE